MRIKIGKIKRDWQYEYVWLEKDSDSKNIIIFFKGDFELQKKIFDKTKCLLEFEVRSYFKSWYINLVYKTKSLRKAIEFIKKLEKAKILQDVNYNKINNINKISILNNLFVLNE